MQLRPEALDAHLEQTLAPLYVIASDEHLLRLEAADSIRAAARKQGCTEREVLTVERGFKWGELQAANSAMSLFGDKKLIELRIPTGRPGKEGAQALQQYVAELHPDNVTLITLPRLDGATQKTAWATALRDVAVYIDIPVVERARLGGWIASRLRLQNQSADAQSIAFLVNRVEGNLLAAHQEIRKLALLYPEGQLDFEQIRDAVLNVARYDVFKLNEAMLTGDTSRFVRMMEGLKGEGEPLPLVLWAITEEVRTLLRLQEGIARGEAVGALVKRLRIWGPREKLLTAALRRLSANTLLQALRQAAQVDKVIKGLRVETLTDDAWDALLQLGLAITRSGAKHET
ncbi:MAG: DNA polymerase III subunit delta [Burkholderiaceae bacterium]|jgi:DNA polymerase-3 subunit delta|nr:DNA polymerase III subunit delta [Burkholderiaceae bacterium]